MRILLVTSLRQRCGITEYGKMLMDSMREHHPDVEICLVGPAADQAVRLVRALASTSQAYDAVHVNHQQALHVSWTRQHIRDVQKHCPVVVTHHDTFENYAILFTRKYSFFLGVADHIVVHEPIAGLDATTRGWSYLRQPVWTEKPIPHPRANRRLRPDEMVVGSVGFDFPWKGFETLRQHAALAGWSVRVLGGDKAWLPRNTAIQNLSDCAATAFLYTTGNSGTSGAIRLGIAAHRPVIAYRGCRQFRDLLEDPGAHEAICWADAHSVQGILETLAADAAYYDTMCRRVSQLAQRDSWANGAEHYYRIYTKVVREYCL